MVVIPRLQCPVSGRRQSPALSHRQAAVSKVLVTQKGGDDRRDGLFAAVVYMKITDLMAEKS